MSAHLEYPALVKVPDIIGAGYVSAVLADDADMQMAYLDAFTPGELLANVTLQLVLMGNTIAAYQHRSPTEVGDSMVAGAFERARMAIAL